MDLAAIEKGENLSKLQRLARERLQTAGDVDRVIFWMDFEESLKELTDYERACFVPCLVEGYTKQELADRFGVSRQAVLKQIKKARRKVKRFLAHGYETP